jgi:hypothetical protein
MPADLITRRGLPTDLEPGAGGDDRRWPSVDGVDDLGAVNALEVHAGNAKVRVSELPLNDDERNAFVSHLDRVRMPELVWGEPSPDAGSRGSVMELLSSCRRLPVPPGRRAVDHAQQRPDRQLVPSLQPRFELAPRPAGPCPPHVAFRLSRDGRGSRRARRRGRSLEAPGLR